MRAVPVVLALTVALALAPAGPGPAQTWFDALVASVDGEPILASDVTLEDVLYGGGRTFATMDTDERAEVVTRLIRRRLLLLEAERFGVADPAPDAVAAEAARVRERLGDGASGIDPKALKGEVREHLRAEAFIDARIRAFVLIRDAQVAAEVARRKTAADGSTRNGPAPDNQAARDALEKQVRQELVAKATHDRLERYITRLEDRATIRRYPVPDLGF